MKITKPGIYRNFDGEAYFSDPCPAPSFTQSIGKVLLSQSPLHAAMAHPRLTTPEDDDSVEKYDAAKAIGNAAHALLIERGKKLAVGPFDNWKTKAAQTFRDDATAAAKVPILQKHMDRASDMADAARKQLKEAGLPEAFNEGDGEVVLAWQEGDLWFRTMIDWIVSPRLCYDYKTTGKSVAPHVVPMTMVNDGWDVQAAMHERGLRALIPNEIGRKTFRFVVQENVPPYALTIWELPEAVMTMGRKKLLMARSIWDQCMTTKTWPAYPLTINYPEYPGYLETKWLQREIEHEERQPRERMLTDLSGG